MKDFYKLKISQKKPNYIIFPTTLLLIFSPFIIKIPVKFAIIIFIIIILSAYIANTPEIILSSFIFLFGTILTFTNPYDYKKMISEIINPSPSITIDEAIKKKFLVPFRLYNSTVRFDLEGRVIETKKMYNYEKLDIYRMMPVVKKDDWDISKPVKLWAYCHYFSSDEYCKKQWENLDNIKVKLSYIHNKKFNTALKQSIDKHNLIVPPVIKYLCIHKDKHEPWHFIYFISTLMLWFFGTLFLRTKVYRDPK